MPSGLFTGLWCVDYWAGAAPEPVPPVGGVVGAPSGCGCGLVVGDGPVCGLSPGIGGAPGAGAWAGGASVAGMMAGG